MNLLKATLLILIVLIGFGCGSRQSSSTAGGEVNRIKQHEKMADDTN